MDEQDNKPILIPMGNSKEDLNLRKEVISHVYRKWTEENPNKRVYNRSLKDYINIRYLSINETMRHAAKTYSSTLALLQLDTILRYSVVYGKPKRGSNQKIFVMRGIANGLEVEMTFKRKNGDWKLTKLTT